MSMPDQATPPARRAGAAAQPVRVVGIGASAGGLDALEHFLAQVPPTSGLAYLVVQPVKHDVLPTLLAARPDGWRMRAWVAGCSTG